MRAQDCRQDAARHLDGWRPLDLAPDDCGGDGASPARPVPVVGCLKLTPEKGCGVVHALARALEGRCRFLLVSGDPAVEACFQGLKHVKVRVRVLHQRNGPIAHGKQEG